MEIMTLLKQYVKTKWLARRFSSREQLVKWQEAQVRVMLSRILPASPFYRKRLGTPEQWRQMEPVDKKCMMGHFDELNTCGIKKEEAFTIALKAETTRDFTPQLNGVTVGLSSGTSGNRGLFLVGPQEQAKWAGVILAKALPGQLWSTHRIAFFLRANSNLYTAVNRRRIQFSFFDLQIPLDQHLDYLNQYQPTVVVAPASMLRMLATAQRQGKLRISPIKVISVAEVLDPLDQTYIAEVFGQIVHQIYQCTEGLLAVSCSHGTLHVNEDLVVVEKEYLDEQKERFFPIITDFSRTTQPIIRYRLNDILTEKRSPCPCGSVFMALESIEGRADDLFVFRHEHEARWISVFPDFIRRAVITSSDAIEEYTVRQLSYEQVEVALLMKNGEGPSMREQERVRQSLERVIADQQGQLPAIVFAPYKLNLGTKKLRRVERMFVPGEQAIN
ncbi:AMP-binding protein [Brevibacillus formosus]|uniref:F390 synthetase-related protein n=1 Tax=Brevibacillus formosus TaxID=54913 RepID=UPI001CA4C809|nr:F390 synthetase-related protein [Brevibacillus formosus]MBW5469531.1 AMP-binding protein [Brevibacillus formosus]